MTPEQAAVVVRLVTRLCYAIVRDAGSECVEHRLNVINIQEELHESLIDPKETG